MSMRTNVSLYDINTLHRSPDWNTPPPPKYSVGDQVNTFKGVRGVVSSILPAPSTSGMKCREHHYYVTINKDRLLLIESEISLAEQ